MIYIFAGQDQYAKDENMSKLQKKYSFDNTMLTVFSEEIPIGDFINAIQSVPMFDDYNVVFAKMTKEVCAFQINYVKCDIFDKNLFSRLTFSLIYGIITEI